MSTVNQCELQRVRLACPSCGHENTPAIRVVAETSRHVAKRPVTPEILDVCPSCSTLLVVSLRPTVAEASTS
jgi:uncharacterized Zn finger protein